MAHVRVAALEELPPGAKLVVVIQGVSILIVNAEGQLYALAETCSHAKAALSAGEFDPDELTVECPLHGSCFDVRTGKPRNLPAFTPVATYPVSVEDAAVFVDYND